MPPFQTVTVSQDSVSDSSRKSSDHTAYVVPYLLQNMSTSEQKRLAKEKNIACSLEEPHDSNSQTMTGPTLIRKAKT